MKEWFLAAQVGFEMMVVASEIVREGLTPEGVSYEMRERGGLTV